ncbi:invasion associated locus B family protein [Martelella sp. FLE1502]
MKRRLSNRTAQFMVVFLASTGAALAADDDVMPSSTTVAYGDWTQNCMLIQMQKEGEPQPGAPQRVCEVRQVLNAQQEGGEVQRLMTVAVGKLPESDTDRLVIQTPVNVALRSGVTMRLGEAAAQPTKGGAVSTVETEGSEQILLTYMTCNQVCIAEKELSEAQMEMIKTAQAASVTFDMTSGQELSVPLSMKGFRSAISAAAPVN